MTYKEQLQTREWKAKRKEILNRDNYTCTVCENKNVTLHVHHNIYFFNKMAWEYEDRYLYTLCEPCHVRQHNIMHELNMEIVSLPPSAIMHILGMIKSIRMKAVRDAFYDNGDILCYADWVVDVLRETTYKKENDEFKDFDDFYNNLH